MAEKLSYDEIYERLIEANKSRFARCEEQGHDWIVRDADSAVCRWCAAAELSPSLGRKVVDALIDGGYVTTPEDAVEAFRMSQRTDP